MENLENDFKMQLYNKESQIIELQSKLDSLSGINKNFTTPEIKRVFINDSSRGKQNINYNNSDLVNNGHYQKKDKNLNYDYLSQFEKSKTINILNNNISIKTIKNYHPNNLSINNNISENKVPLGKYLYNNFNNDRQKRSLEKNNSAPNIYLHNFNSNNVRKKFLLNNAKKNKFKNSKIKSEEERINYLLKERDGKNKREIKYSKNNYQKVKLPFYIANSNKNLDDKLKLNININTINENLIEKIKKKNKEEYLKYINLKPEEIENLNNIKANRKVNVKSCESRTYIIPHKKLKKNFNKMISTSNFEKDLNKNNTTFNFLFKNLNNEKGERNNFLKNLILHNKLNDQNKNIIFNLQMDKSNINNSRKMSLNNISGKIYLDSYNKAVNKKSN